jgi:hypothetical protein
MIAWLTETAWRHVAVEEIDVAHKTRVEKGRLIDGSFAATDRRTAPRGTIFLKLFAQCSQGPAFLRGYSTADAVYCAYRVAEDRASVAPDERQRQRWRSAGPRCEFQFPAREA